MSFPFSVQGQFTISGEGDTDLRDALVLKATDLLWRRSDAVTIENWVVISKPSWAAAFMAPGGNWHPIGVFDEVRLAFSGTKTEAVVRYDMSTRRLLIIAAFIGILADFMLSLLSRPISIFRLEYLNSLPKLISIPLSLFVVISGYGYIYYGILGPMWLRAKLRSR